MPSDEGKVCVDPWANARRLLRFLDSGAVVDLVTGTDYVTIEDAHRLLRDHGPLIGERLAQLAIEWTVANLGGTGYAIHADLMDNLPTVKMYTAQEIIDHFNVELREEDLGNTVAVGYVTDGNATEYLRFDPATLEFRTEAS